MKAAKSCYAQAKGEAVVSSVQLPTGDENDGLGTEPDIDETAITETVDTDILIVGAGNGLSLIHISGGPAESGQPRNFDRHHAGARLQPRKV